MCRHVYRTLDPDDDTTPAESVGDAAMGALIFANVLAAILETVQGVPQQYGTLLERFEAFSVLIFSVEYVLRVWTSVENRRFARPIAGRLRFIFTPMALLDLAVILPWFLPTVRVDLRFIRILRLVRLMRVLKFVRYSHALQTFVDVFHEKRPDLAVVMVILSVMVVLASSLMFIVEGPAQPQAFSSIPAAMWWSVVTLTTVGYGDVYPVTMAGRALGAVIAVVGIGFFALPAGLLASGFAEAIARQNAEPTKCPHCGKPIEK